jgi:hypothetical protein
VILALGGAWCHSLRRRRNGRNMTDDLKGGCACGAVRYQFASAPMFVHCCHCRDCQRQTGSAFVLNALIEADQVILLSGNWSAPHRVDR